MIFVEKGAPLLTEAQLSKRTQDFINRDWPQWKRERSIRKNDGEFNTFMESIELATDINRANNLFNAQLAAYKQAILRLEKYKVADGREKVTELQPTGEYVWNEDTKSVDTVMETVVTQTYVAPVEGTVEQTVNISGDPDVEPKVVTVTNPAILKDVFERAEAQEVIDNTPAEVKSSNLIK